MRVPAHVEPDLKTALAFESMRALARLRSTGESPTPETAPWLMATWRAARDKLTGAARAHAVSVFFYKGQRFHVASIWDRRGNLHKFFLRDHCTGALLLAGDDKGPVFAQQTEEPVSAPSSLKSDTRANAIPTTSCSQEG